MPTAILFSGQFRTFAACLPTQHWHVYRHLPDPHFFMMMQDCPDAKAHSETLAKAYGADHVHIKLIEDPKGLPMIPLKAGAHAPFANAAPHPQLMMQHWYQNEVWERFKHYPDFAKFDLVVRMRCDNFFHSFTPLNYQPRVVYSPWWGRFGGINDRFAVMSRDDAPAYFTVYPRIQKLLNKGCPFHPESLSKAAIEDDGSYSCDLLRAEFSTWRLNGQHRHMEILAGDIAHLAGGG